VLKGGARRIVQIELLDALEQRWNPREKDNRKWGRKHRIIQQIGKPFKSCSIVKKRGRTSMGTHTNS